MDTKAKRNAILDANIPAEVVLEVLKKAYEASHESDSAERLADAATIANDALCRLYGRGQSK